MSKTIKHALESLIQEIKQDSNKAEANFEATTILKDKVKVAGSSRQFTYHFDEPQAIGGDDSAPNPVEYVLATLGECQTITYKAIATLKGIELDQVKIKTKGNIDFHGFLGLDSNVRPGFQDIEFETTLTSNEDFDKLLRLSKQVESLCPVLDIISNPVEVTNAIKIRNSQGEITQL